MAPIVRGGQQTQGRAVLNPADTIAALSTGRPPAAIAIIRISGPAALAAATLLAGSLPPPRQASLRALRAQDGDLLDQALVLVFPGPDSATGEDLVELHCHGGRAVVAAVEAALQAIPGVRGAEPGEFTRRALFNSRIDLSEAEGLADLLEAETEMQRRAALMAAEGTVSRAIRGWMERATAISAELEALIDYTDEADVEAEASSLAHLVNHQRQLADEIAQAVAAPPVERWRDGIRIVVAGPPNAGKSTLVNLLAQRDGAIVSPVAGTTRDRIEMPVRHKGKAYILIDTAGLHDETDDPVELIGIVRAQEAIGGADLTLWLGDDAPAGENMIWLHARSDLPGRRSRAPGAALAISAADPASIDQVWIAIDHHPATMIDVVAIPLRQRELTACRNAAVALDHALIDPVLQAEQLRIATHALGEALGVNATEAMLNSLFSRFCVGK